MKNKIKLSLLTIIAGLIFGDNAVQAAERGNPGEGRYRHLLGSSYSTSKPVTHNRRSLTTQTNDNTLRRPAVDNRRHHPAYSLQRTQTNDNGSVIRTFQAGTVTAGAYLDYADDRSNITGAEKTFKLHQSGKYIGAASIISGKPGTSDITRLPEVGNCFIGTEEPKQLLALTDTTTRALTSNEGFKCTFEAPTTVLNNIKPFASYFDYYSDYNQSIQALVDEWGQDNVKVSNIGHSVGGPRALLSLMYTRNKFGIGKNQQVFTFGATPLLNSAAVQQIDDLDLSITNVYNIQDEIWKTPRSFSNTYVNMPGYVFYLYDNGQTGIAAHQWKTGYFNNLAGNVRKGKLHMGSSFHKTSFATTNPTVPDEIKLLVGLGRLFLG